jgi:hypothetical protein
MVKLLRVKSGWSKTSTELPVLDLARTADKRQNRERKTVPRDGNILVYVVPDEGHGGEDEDQVVSCHPRDT